ncbi:MAG: TetR/AcrR family transcriptional regulator [Betaproteobacteria bacterium]|nr:TetR/AcrR family transcriptional regulator [Betaproteobacteria bacterium]
MARPPGVSGADTMRAIRKAAIARIFRYGFEAMNLRDLAADVNLKLGSLYNYIPQKQEFLSVLLESTLHELLSDLDAQVSPIADPREKLFAFVRFHTEWHTARKEEVFIGNMELRSLSPQQYVRVIALRKRYEAYLQSILSQGAKAGYWTIRDAKVTSYAVLAMLTGVSNWYRPDGRLSQAKLVKLHERLVAGAIGVQEPMAAPRSAIRHK